MWSTMLEAPRERDRGWHRLVLRPDLDRNTAESGLWSGSLGGEDEARLQLRERVREAVAEALTDKQRAAVELYFFEGLPQAEVARRLGVSQQVVQRCLYGARRGGRVVGGAIPRLRAVLSLPSAGDSLP